MRRKTVDYNFLSENIQNKILEKNPKLRNNLINSTRRRCDHDIPNLWRPAFVRDCEKILHCPYYNRYSDKTQVFSFYKNDDISRRSLHVQLVSRIARNISSMLGLNVDLTEAIALGHDMGHPPFGHAGESCLNRISMALTGRAFLHNVHSVRVLDKVCDYNISLETLDGILCHNGELPLGKYIPDKTRTFDEFDRVVELCYKEADFSKKLIPSTLEGCVVRVSDLIAYIGKDRQDATRAKVIEGDSVFSEGKLGRFNASIINNLIVNVIENSFDKDYIMVDPEYFEELKLAMKENYEHIYMNESVKKVQDELISPMYEKLFSKLLSELKTRDENSLVFKHHISYVNRIRSYYSDTDYFEQNSPEEIVIDYISSMTDDYFSDLYGMYFPHDVKPQYHSYFAD